MQLVAAEPMVQDPVVIRFDEDGRLWVVEMRGFMPDEEGRGEKAPVGRISVLEDTNNDGKMDISKVYLDSLIMPRAIALVPGGALVAENGSLWLTQDLDGDLRADTRELIDSAYAGGPSPEHAGNGLLRNTDNWYYNAKSRFRYRLTNGKWQRDSTEFRGQWGITHDDNGRLYYNYNWSQLHADLVPPNYFSRNKNHITTTGIDYGLTNDRRVYPIRPNPAVNRGYIPGTFDSLGRLLEFTAACSPLYYRGAALPKEYYGNVFVCEPAGNLVKRDIITENGPLLAAHDANPGKEFLASTDERFRPVDLTTGPDGALYLADMYRGLIQHVTYVTPYLRDQSIKRKLVQPINRGRIWRIVPKNWQAPAARKLSHASTTELVKTLSDTDGWYRDMSQRLLVERNDKGCYEALVALALHGNERLGRYQALWTLEGLNVLDPQILFQLLADSDVLIRSTALRLLEPACLESEAIRVKVGDELLRTWSRAPLEQVLQSTLTAAVLNKAASQQLLTAIAERYDTSALMRDAILSSLANEELDFLMQLWKIPSWQKEEPAKAILIEMLTAAVVHKRNSEELARLLNLLDVKSRFGWKEKALLAAVTIQAKNTAMKAIRLSTAPLGLTHTGSKEKQEDMLPLLSMFAWPGHEPANVVAQAKHPLTETDQKQFVFGRQLYLTTCAGCHGPDGAGLARFAPPLAGSDWVLGNDKRLVFVVLHGMEGAITVKGKLYDVPAILPEMPAHSTLADGTIAAILTYIRNEWGNDAGAVSGRLVSTTRNTSQGRVIPWTPGELNKHVREISSVK